MLTAKCRGPIFLVQPVQTTTWLGEDFAPERQHLWTNTAVVAACTINTWWYTVQSPIINAPSYTCTINAGGRYRPTKHLHASLTYVPSAKLQARRTTVCESHCSVLSFLHHILSNCTCNFTITFNSYHLKFMAPHLCIVKGEKCTSWNNTTKRQITNNNFTVILYISQHKIAQTSVRIAVSSSKLSRSSTGWNHLIFTLLMLQNTTSTYAQTAVVETTDYGLIELRFYVPPDTK